MEISITTTTYNDKDRELVKQALHRLITEQLSANLNIETLQEVFVPEDFGQEILLFQRKYNLKETGHTNNELGSAIAKTIGYHENGEFLQVVFLDKRLVSALFVEEGKQTAVHFIHHELCHVHDEYHKSKIFSEESRIGYSSSLTYMLFYHSDIVWSEYIANRLSVGTLAQDFDLNIPFLFDLIDKTKRSTNEQIQKYEHHGDIDRLFAEIQDGSSLLLRIACNVCGYLHGLSLPELDISVNDKMAQTDFKVVWFRLNEELQNLYSLYPNWIGLAQYQGLSSVILECWNLLGIYPRMTDKGIYIDVP